MTQVPFAALGGCFNSGGVPPFFAPWSAGPKPAAVRFPLRGWASGVLTREKTAAGAAAARPGAVEIPPGPENTVLGPVPLDTRIQ